MFRAATFAALCLGLGLAVAQQPARAPAVTMEDIKKAWQDRQDKVKTLKMKWELQILHPKGSAIGLKSDQSTVYAERDLTLTGESNFYLWDEKYHLKAKRQAWSVEKSERREYEFRKMFDGQRHLHYVHPVGELGGAHWDKMNNVTDNSDAVPLLPLWWMFRGTSNRKSSRILDELEPTGRSVRVNGLTCVETGSRSRTARTETRLYLDGNRGFVPVRYEVLGGTTVLAQLHLEYVAEPECGWRPASWHYTLNTSTGVVRESQRCKVTVCEVNPRFTGEEFAADLPPGAVVTDHTPGEPRLSVVRPDGSAGTELPLSARPTREMLVAVNDRPLFPFRTVAGLLALAWSVGIVVWLVRRSRGGLKPPPPSSSLE